MKPHLPFLFSIAALLAPSGAASPELRAPETRVERNLVFAIHGDRQLTLDLHLPDERLSDLPVVVWIYGGAWMTRNKAAQAQRAAWLASFGYAVAIIDHRLSSEALFPAQIHDCKAAVRWLRRNAETYGLNATRIGAWGESSGGHLASLLGLTDGIADLEPQADEGQVSAAVKAVVNFFGPTDFLQMDAHAPPGAPFQHDDRESPESRLVGGPIQQMVAEVQRANPVAYVTESAPPFLIVHGEKDVLVPSHQSELLFEALSAAGADVTFYKIAGAGHGGPAFESALMRAAVRAFFDKHLKD